ncbi:hypothetical protein F4604DRAFT_1673403 [Suillus subluteus]|nr:hypothetical protein F4604DRAFT_1673403 [Suillus subluteus]
MSPGIQTVRTGIKSDRINRIFTKFHLLSQTGVTSRAKLLSDFWLSKSAKADWFFVTRRNEAGSTIFATLLMVMSAEWVTTYVFGTFQATSPAILILQLILASLHVGLGGAKTSVQTIHLTTPHQQLLDVMLPEAVPIYLRVVHLLEILLPALPKKADLIPLTSDMPYNTVRLSPVQDDIESAYTKFGVGPGAQAKV